MKKALKGKKEFFASFAAVWTYKSAADRKKRPDDIWFRGIFIPYHKGFNNNQIKNTKETAVTQKGSFFSFLTI